MTDPRILGDKLATDLETTLQFIADYFSGDPPTFFDEYLRDIKAWRASPAGGDGGGSRGTHG